MGGARSGVSTDPEKVETYLENHHVSPILKRFTHTESSLENFDFLQAVRHFRKKPTLRMAKEIFDRYVSKDAPQRANVENKHLEIISQVFEQVKRARSRKGKKALLRTIFDPSYEHILQMLRQDVFPRFKRSGAYGEAVKKFQDMRSMAPAELARSWKQGVEEKRGAYGKLKESYRKKWGIQTEELRS